LYLNEIRIYGFKSFPEPITLKLNRGIIGFVGPNGNGKSNIVDAIRWVLGEQSAKELRATLMEDLIFHGTQKRSQANLASSALKFSNDGELPLDFSEIEIERKIYRSGESQYLINKETVRLKDIQNLLADMGLGTRTYSLFKKSLIEDIVQNKPEALRNLFEESAGIFLYRQSKRETLRKLIATQENLYRINDLIQEVEKQEKELKKQSGRAKRYNEMTEIVKNLSQYVYKEKDKSLTAIIENTDLSIKEKNDKIDEIILEIDDLKEKITSIKYERKSIENELAILGIKKEKGSEELYQINSDILVMNERKKSLEDQIKSNEEFKEKQVLENPAKKERMKNNESRFEVLLNRIKDVQKERDEKLNGEIEKQYNNAQQEFNQKSAEKRKKENDIFLLKSKLNSIVYKKENQNKRMEEKSSEINYENESILKLKQEDSEKLNEIENSQKTINALNSEINKMEELINDKKNQQKQFFAKKENITKEISGEESRKEQIINRINEARGTIEEIEKALDKSGIEQLRNLVTAKEGYENYLKTALSHILNAVILSKGDVNRIENMNLPLLTIILSDYEGSAKERKDTLNNFVDGPEFIKRFLSRFIITDNKDEPFEKEDGFYYIWKNGILITPEKMIIKSGEIRIVNFKNALEKTQSRLTELFSISAKNSEDIELVKNALNTLNLEMNRKKQAVTDADNKRIFLQETEKAIKKNIEAKFIFISQLKENFNLLQKDIDAMILEEKELNENIEKLEKDISDISTNLLAMETWLNSLKETYIIYTNRKGEIENIYETLENEKNILKKEIEDLKNVIDSFENDLSKLDKFIDDSSLQIQLLKKSINEKEEAKIKHQSALLLLDEQLKKLSDKIEEIENTVRQFEEKEEEYRSLMESFKNKREEILIQREKYMTERDFNRQNIDETIEIENEIISKYLENAEEELKYMTEKLTNMGPINQLAFQEYAEIAERLEQMVKQKDDIIQSKENLEKTIKTIDAKAKTIFVQYFDTIKTSFKDLFYEIFRSGNADINLVDETDPLESDIQITFEPGEKKIGKLVQLSSGERTLMIILLLFSMYMVKPTPMCIMDEIDASLDDANVENFINLLKKFKEKTQFILITHNKRTMEFCDYLFGVTMEESGITSIFSLNLQTISQKFLENATKSN